ncbi:MAG TPA: hypothetical protein VE326_01305 [Candidatus Binatia bacterium]|nr:hypothetical protein [Candidatus Binatia bacterium]
MLSRLTLRSIGPHRGAGRACRARAARLAASVPLLAFPSLLFAARIAMAAPGSGAAQIIQPDSAVAGSRHQWTVVYDPSEDFGNPQGGVLEVRIPNGWTPPQRASSGAPGYVDYTNATAVTSISISGQTVRLVLGGGPPATKKFLASDLISVLYGVGGPSSQAVTDTVAGVARFTVSSDPQNTGTLDTLAAGSPRVRVLPDAVAAVRIADGAGVEVGGLARTTDQDTTHFYLRGYDRYGNFARFVNGAWRVTGGIGFLTDSTVSSRRLVVNRPGAGKVFADSGSWHDSTNAVIVFHGAYAALVATAAGSATAGGPFAATAEARDADGNRVTDDVGSAQPVRFVGYTDSLGAAPSDPSFVSPNATLTAGAWSGTLTARRAGVFYVAARDTLTGRESAPRFRLNVAPSVPDHLELRPDTLRLAAGTPDTVTVVARDVFGNRAPFSAPEELTLWTDRPQGRFEDLGGSPIFSVVVPAGRDSADVRFRDTQATTAPGRMRVIDANGVAPFVGFAESAVLTAPAAPAGTLALTALPDTLVAGGVDSATVVSGVVRDAFGNAVAAGERFTATGTGLGVITDADPGTPGFQWTVAADGTVSGRVRAGTVAGAAGLGLVSERGSATGAAALRLVAGPPAGSIALSASPDSVAADGISVRSIAASGLGDAFLNPVQDGEAYTVSTTLGSIATADADPVTPGVQVRAAGGAIAFDLLGGSVLGTAVLSAASVRGTASGSISVRLVPGAVSADSSSVTATSPVPVGAPGSVVTVTLRDRRGHALALVPSDSITVSSSGVPIAAAPLAGATDSGGAIAYAATATATGPAALSVTARGVPLTAPTILYVPGALDTLVLSGPAGPLTAGAAESLRVEARDAFGNAMPGRTDTVHLAATTGAATGLPATVALSGGVATVPFTPSLAAPLTIAVTDDSSHAASYGPVVVAAGAPYRLAADPPGAGTLPAGGSTTVRARVFDAFGNAAPGDTVAASVVLGGGSVVPAAAVTDVSGAADFTLNAGSAPGTVTLRLTVLGSAAPDAVRSDSVSVSVAPSSAATVEIAAAGTVTAGSPLDLAITLRDAFGNVALGAVPTLQLDTSSSLPDSVSWSIGPGAVGSLVDDPADDRASYTFAPADSGTVTLRVRLTRAETLRLSASGVGPIASSGDVVVTPAAPATLAASGGDGQTAVVDRLLAQPLRVTVRDAFGNPAPGAVVSFRVRAGGGSLDVVSGAPADSDAVTGASGEARCDVVRLGTVAGVSNNRIAALLPVAGDSVLFSATALPDTAAALLLQPSSLSLGPGGASPVTATARDRFGNPVPGAPLTFYLGSAPAGSLESLGATSGTGTTQAGVTDAAGSLAVRYRAPTAAPAGDLIYARGTSVGPVSIAASIAPSGVDSLVVLPDAASWTAGAPVRVRVRALDASGNPALGDTATIVMGSTGGGVSFAPAFGSLSGGDFVTFATATAAGPLQVTARAAGGGATFTSGPVVVAPAAPSGAIPIAAARDTLTADGRSTTTVTFGPLRDAYGNTAAPGTLITVSADSLVAPDASPSPGLQIATGAGDLARAVLVAPAVAGPGMIRAASVLGSARDSLAVVYLPPPSLAFAGALSPTVVAPGQTASFALDVRNAAASGSVTLGTGSLFSFGSGAGAYSVPLTSAVTIPAGAVRTLAMTGAPVSAGLLPGTYAPSLRAVGTDAAGGPLDFYLSLAGAQVHVAGVQVAAVGAAPDPVPLGSAGLALTYRVDNLAATAAVIDAVALTPSAFVVTGVTPPLPAALGALGSTTLTLTVAVPSSGIPDGTEIAADLAASVSYGTATVQGATQSPLRFQVISGATLTSSPAGTAPSRYLRGRAFAPAARLTNSGTASVTLNPGATRLVLTRGAARLTTGLAAATVVPGSAAADLAFDSLAIPAGATLGRYAAALALSGTESGQAFADTIPLAPDSVDVIEPALLAVSGPLVPARVSAGQTRSLAVTVANAGDVPYVLSPATRLTLDAPVFTSLAPASAGTIPARGSLVVTFGPAALGTSTAAPGAAPALLEAHGTEDGRARDEALDAGSLAVEAPARLAYVPGSTAPDTVRAGQTMSLAATIRNDGGSTFLIDPAATTLLVTDGVESAAAAASGSPFALAPGASAPLAFNAVAFPAALASQAYPVALLVHGTEWGLAESTAVVSPAGELSVVEPVAALQVRGLPGGAPVQVAPEDGPVRLWTLELTPLVATGGAASSHLVTAAFTVLVDGAPASNAAAAVDRITLRDDQGSILAQGSPGAGPGKVALTLASPLALTGPPVTLRVDVALHPGSAARAVALRLADPSDLDVRDDLTQTPVAVRAAGGLPFEPITSTAVTLFAKPHGYPNPFRAGREDVRLSYRLAADASVHVAIYTLLGDLVREMALAAGGPGGAAGLNEVAWDGRNGKGETVRPGVYVARIEGGGVNEAVKVGVLR